MITHSICRTPFVHADIMNNVSVGKWSLATATDISWIRQSLRTHIQELSNHVGISPAFITSPYYWMNLSRVHHIPMLLDEYLPRSSHPHITGWISPAFITSPYYWMNISRVHHIPILLDEYLPRSLHPHITGCPWRKCTTKIDIQFHIIMSIFVWDFEKLCNCQGFFLCSKFLSFKMQKNKFSNRYPL